MPTISGGHIIEGATSDLTPPDRALLDGIGGGVGPVITTNGTGDVGPVGILIGTPHFTFPIPDPDYGDGQHGYRLVIAGAPADSNDQNAALIAGSNVPGYNNSGVLALSYGFIALQGTAVTGIGIAATSTSGTALRATSTDGVGAYLASTNGVGAQVVGASPAALDVQGGALALTAMAAPPAPEAANVVYLYLDSADGKVKIKDSTDTVHALW